LSITTVLIMSYTAAIGAALRCSISASPKSKWQMCNFRHQYLNSFGPLCLMYPSSVKQPSHFTFQFPACSCCFLLQLCPCYFCPLT